jgi:hypothetical protein
LAVAVPAAGQLFGATLHEYVPDVGVAEGTPLVRGPTSEPAAILHDGEVLPAPEGGPATAQERPMRASPGDGQRTEEAGRRSPTFVPDRQTELDGTLGYDRVFTPSIAPFKRVATLDRVGLSGRTPILVQRGGSRRAVPVVGAEAPSPDARDRDRFWGNVLLDFSEGSTVPFPSVAPDARLLTVRTEPAVTLRFTVGAGDNFYASLVGPVPEGPVRVIFLTDAPRSYFGGSLPSGARADALRDRVPRLPASVRQDALRFARGDLGLSPEQPFDRVVGELVRHFRSFEESAEPPAATSNIYLDLSRGRRGVCRHRAYGFVITAHALGVHARFVQNEAHAWVEIERPSADGWLRVDLGGAAAGLEARGRERPPYRPSVEDELPQPPEYASTTEPTSREAPGGGGRRDGPGSAGGSPRRVPTTTAPPADGPPAPLTLRVDRRRFDVFRGRELEITGRALDPAGVPGLRVEVLLRDGASERLLGVTVTGEEGTFRGVFGVPPDLPVGEYELVVRTPGDRDHAPAIAR